MPHHCSTTQVSNNLGFATGGGADQVTGRESTRQPSPLLQWSVLCIAWGQFPLSMSHLSPNELESLVQEADEAAGAGYAAVAGGEVAPVSRPAQEQPNAKRAKCAFAGDVDIPRWLSESYEKWAQWRDHVAATFHAFVGDNLAAKKAGEYHAELMHRGLDQAGVDMATEWAAPHPSYTKRS